MMSTKYYKMIPQLELGAKLKNFDGFFIRANFKCNISL